MKQLFLLLTPLLFSLASFGQNVGIGTSSPHPSAALEIADSSKGILIPRLTMNQRLSIRNPAEGLMIYQTNDVKGYWYFDGEIWQSVFSKKENSDLQSVIYTINGF
jgi:hypothetical protein